MNKDQEVQGYNRAIGKEALKAMTFFFVGLPLLGLAVALTVTYGVKFLAPTCLVLAGALWLIKRSKALTA